MIGAALHVLWTTDPLVILFGGLLLGFLAGGAFGYRCAWVDSAGGAEMCGPSDTAHLSHSGNPGP